LLVFSKYMTSKKASPVRMKQYADVFSAIGAEPRLRILQLLLAADAEGMTVNEIQSALKIPGSTLSHHLEKLKTKRLVTVRREGTFLWHSANAKALQDAVSFLSADCGLNPA
jgi:DNA-binding transcriptional ArsR family regulator